MAWPGRFRSPPGAVADCRECFLVVLQDSGESVRLRGRRLVLARQHIGRLVGDAWYVLGELREIDGIRYV